MLYRMILKYYFGQTALSYANTILAFQLLSVSDLAMKKMTKKTFLRTFKKFLKTFKKCTTFQHSWTSLSSKRKTDWYDNSINTRKTFGH